MSVGSNKIVYEANTILVLVEYYKGNEDEECMYGDCLNSGLSVFFSNSYSIENEALNIKGRQ